MNMKLELGQSLMGTPLSFDGIPNFHMQILGLSGMGKSYKLKTLIPQVVEKGARCFIFDCTGDFLTVDTEEFPQWEYANVEVFKMRDKFLSLALFEPHNSDETIEDIGDRLSDMLHVGLKLGDSQWAYISECIINGLSCGAIKTFQDVVDLVEADIKYEDPARRMLPKIKKLNRILPSGTTPTDWKLDSPGITILDLHQIKDPASQALLVEMLLGAICGKRMGGIPEACPPVVLVFDECQRLRLTEGSFAHRILREGRKYNLSGWFSTQWIRNEQEEDALSQAGLKIYFRLEGNVLRRTVKSLGISDLETRKRYEHLLSTLPRGQFLYRRGKQMYLSKAPKLHT